MAATDGQDEGLSEGAMPKGGERERRRRIIEAAVKAVPVGMYCEWAGRPHNVVTRSAEVWGVPFGGEDGVVNLPVLIRAWHDFLAKHHSALSAAMRVGGGEGVAVAAQLKQVELKTKRLALAEREKTLVPFHQVQGSLVGLFQGIKRALERMQQSVGAEAVRPLREELEFQSREWHRHFGQATDLLAPDPRDAEIERLKAEIEALKAAKGGGDVS